MNERTRTPKRAPARRRKRESVERRVPHRAEQLPVAPTHETAAQPQGGGGSFGGGPVDDDGGRKPERPHGDAKKLLVVLGILALGAGAISVRLLATTQRRHDAVRR